MAVSLPHPAILPIVRMSKALLLSLHPHPGGMEPRNPTKDSPGVASLFLDEALIGILIHAKPRATRCAAPSSVRSAGRIGNCSA